KIEGSDNNEMPKKKIWYILAKNGDGLYIPATPSIIIAKKIIRGQLSDAGAYTSIGLINHDELMQELQFYNIKEIII
ncbi:MAG: potassium transporter, partial [Pseudomonadota bacterium]